MCKTKKCSVGSFKATQADSPRVVAYVRCAIDDAERVAAQMTQIQRHAERRGWELDRVYTDTGQSGNSPERPELQSLQRDIEAGLVDTVIVERFDRLYRNLEDLSRFVQLLNCYNVTLISHSQENACQNHWSDLVRHVLNDPGRSPNPLTDKARAGGTISPMEGE